LIQVSDGGFESYLAEEIQKSENKIMTHKLHLNHTKHMRRALLFQASLSTKGEKKEKFCFEVVPQKERER